MFLFEVAPLGLRPCSNDKVFIRRYGYTVGFTLRVWKRRPNVVLETLELYIYCPSRRQREATGSPREATGDHGGQFPRTDLGPAHGI